MIITLALLNAKEAVMKTIFGNGQVGSRSYPHTLEDAFDSVIWGIERVRRIGYDAIEYNVEGWNAFLGSSHHILEDVPLEIWQEVAMKAREIGLRQNSIHGLTLGSNFSDHEAILKRQKHFIDTAYALAKEEIDAGNIGKIISIKAKRNLARWITESSLNKISALFGDGIHDFDLMLWYTGAKPKTVYAQTINTRPEFKYDDVASALFRLNDGTFAAIENNWSLPDSAPFAIDAKMEIIGSEGIINIDNSGNNYSVLTKKGISYPQSTYWPKVHGMRRGFLKEEFDYFLKCIAGGKKPEVITPRESRDVVYAMRMAEKSARENRVIEF